MMKVILIIIAALYLANGAAMLVVPQLWYHLTPGVVETGPYNGHFIRDIGLAFLGASIQALLMFFAKGFRFLLATAPIIFIGGHGAFHLLEIIYHQPPMGEIVRDLVLVIIPSLLFCAFLISHLANKEFSR